METEHDVRHHFQIPGVGGALPHITPLRPPMIRIFPVTVARLPAQLVDRLQRHRARCVQRHRRLTHASTWLMTKANDVTRIHKQSTRTVAKIT